MAGLECARFLFSARRVSQQPVLVKASPVWERLREPRERRQVQPELEVWRHRWVEARQVCLEELAAARRQHLVAAEAAHPERSEERPAVLARRMVVASALRARLWVASVRLVSAGRVERRQRALRFRVSGWNQAR